MNNAAVISVVKVFILFTCSLNSSTYYNVTKKHNFLPLCSQHNYETELLLLFWTTPQCLDI
jgi:hypothetical protein